MDKLEILERNAFLTDLEERFASGDDGAILEMARERLGQLPGDPDARIALCRLWIRQDKLDEALEMLRELEEFLVGLSRLYASLGDLSLKKGMQEKARIWYQKSRALHSDSPEAGRRLGEIEGLQEKDEDGQEGVSGAEEEPTDIPADFQTVTLAELYLRQGHPEQAAEVLESILRRDPQQEKAEKMLREIREGLGRKDDLGGRDPVVAELSRWLDRIARRSAHAE